ncbi:MAG: hypothetical protein DMF42_05530 [Verrucomicrobia bacterium]|nr:MAG: hypothetical protein DMF42_05530 [Verrucomicrobiota bacterium]
MVHRNKYPQAEYPYTRLVDEIRLTVANRGPEKATLHLLPTLWFRNTWSWGEIAEECTDRPSLMLEGDGIVRAKHGRLGEYQFTYEGKATPLFTENETNSSRLYGYPNGQPFVKDAFHEYVVHRRTDAVNPERTGTKFATHYVLEIEPGQSHVVRLRLSAVAGSGDAGQPGSTPPATTFGDFDQIFTQRIKEADEFYDAVIPSEMDKESKKVARQGYAGLLWSKQFYHYAIRDWLAGDPAQPPPPPERNFGRNREWAHLFINIIGDLVNVVTRHDYRSLIGLPIAGAMIFYLA